MLKRQMTSSGTQDGTEKTLDCYKIVLVVCFIVLIIIIIK